jgi:hypothetical protein
MSDLEDYGALLRSGAASVPDYAAQEAQKQLQTIQVAEARQQLAKTQRDALEQQNFQTDLTHVLANPSPAGYSALALRHPAHAEQIKTGFEIQDKAKRDSDLSAMVDIYAPAQAGKYSLAAALLQRRIDADKAAGQDITHDKMLLDALNSGDPTQQKAAVGMMGYTLAAITGDKFNETLATLNKPKGYTLAPGDVRFDDNDKKVASVDAKPDFLVVPEGGKAIPLNPAASAVGTGGGGQTSPGVASPAAPGAVVSRTHGYTPRQRDGGDNPDHVVDGKIAALSSAVGVDPDTPMNPHQFAAFVSALPTTEGTTNSLTGKNNNPGGIKDGQFAKAQPGYAGAWKGYAVFKDQQSGTAAMQKLLTNRFYNRGQQSIRDIIEGRPGGASSAASPAAGGAPQAAQPGDIPGTVYGNPKPQARTLTPDEATARGLSPAKVYEQRPDGTVSAIGDAAPAVAPGDSSLSGPAYIAQLAKTNVSLANQVQGVLDTRLAYPPATARSSAAQQLRAAVLQADPSYDEQAYKRRQTTIQQYTPGHAGPGASMLSAATIINHMYDLAQAARNLPDHSTAAQNAMSSWYASQTNQSWLIKFNEGRKFVSSELPKFLNGKAPTEGEQRDHYDSYSPSKGKSGIQTALSTDVDYLYGRYQPLIQAYRDNVGKDLNIDNYAPGQATQAKAAALEYYRANGALPTVVTNPAQAAKLPHGSVFVTPDGRILRRH